MYKRSLTTTNSDMSESFKPLRVFRRVTRFSVSCSSGGSQSTQPSATQVLPPIPPLSLDYLEKLEGAGANLFPTIHNGLPEPKHPAP